VQHTRNGFIRAIVAVVAVAAFGAAGLPTLFNGSGDTRGAAAWLILAIIDCMLLLAPARRIANGLTSLLLRLPGAQQSSVGSIAWLVICATDLVIIQAILRNPLVLALGDAQPFVVESVVANVSLLALIGVLMCIYCSAGQLIETLAFLALDSTLATAEPHRENSSKVSSAIRESRQEVTVPLDAATQLRSERAES